MSTKRKSRSELADLPRSLPAIYHVDLSNVQTSRLILLLLTWAAAALRFDGLFSSGLHPDEALFASWARTIGVWRDPLLLAEVVDKPPLLFYLQALHFPLAGTAAPWVARLPVLAASLLVVPLTARLVWEHYGDQFAALSAATLLAFSPVATQFSATAFIDPLLVSLLLGSLIFVACGKAQRSRSILHRSFFAGLFFGLATTAKYQAWLFLPLLVALALLHQWRRGQWLRWAAGTALPVFALLSWDFARSAPIGLWTQQMESYGGLRLAWSWELWPRLEAWAQLWSNVIGSPILGFLLLLGLPIFLALLISEQDWSSASDQIFVGFVIAYALGHWFVAVPVWERYLVAAAPLVALLIGRFISRLITFVGRALPLPTRVMEGILFLLLCLLLLAPAVGGPSRDSGDREESDAGGGPAGVAAQLADEPYGTVLYDHWYSWQWKYYLFDSAVYVSWFPHPGALVRDLVAFGGDGAARYMVLPADEVAQPVWRAVRGAGFSMRTVYEADGMVLYRLSRDG